MSYTLDQAIKQITRNIDNLPKEALKDVADYEVEVSKSQSPIETGSLQSSIRITNSGKNSVRIEAHGGKDGKSYASIQEYERGFYHSTGNYNYMGTQNGELDNRVRKAMKDVERRTKI